MNMKSTKLILSWECLFYEVQSICKSSFSQLVSRWYSCTYARELKAESNTLQVAASGIICSCWIWNRSNLYFHCYFHQHLTGLHWTAINNNLHSELKHIITSRTLFIPQAIILISKNILTKISIIISAAAHCNLVIKWFQIFTDSKLIGF